MIVQPKVSEIRESLSVFDFDLAAIPKPALAKDFELPYIIEDFFKEHPQVKRAKMVGFTDYGDTLPGIARIDFEDGRYGLLNRELREFAMVSLTSSNKTV